MGYSGAGGKLIDEKNQKRKISWHCPFKRIEGIAHLKILIIFKLNYNKGKHVWKLQPLGHHYRFNWVYTAKTVYGKFETNIPSNETGRPQS